MNVKLTSKVYNAGIRARTGWPTAWLSMPSCCSSGPKPTKQRGRGRGKMGKRKREREEGGRRRGKNEGREMVRPAERSLTL